MSVRNKALVNDFISVIWNQNNFSVIDKYLHNGFIDHSLPSFLAPDKEGLQNWISATGKSFQHITIIDEMVSEKDKVIIKIRMKLKHIGKWREIEATGTEITTVGYRNFKLLNNKIIEHSALIDGNAIESKLKEVQTHCKTQD